MTQRMAVDDAIASFFAWFKRQPYAKEPCISAPVFFLGEERELDDCFVSLANDIWPSLTHKIPIPFDVQWVLMKTGYVEGVALGYTITLCARINEHPTTMAIQDFALISSGWTSMLSCVGKASFPDDVLGDVRIDLSFDRDGLSSYEEDLVRDSFYSSVKQVALISHPGNYIVKECPQLTEKEARKVRLGRSIPDAKRPRYIVLDHEVLVGLRTPSGSHSSPTPHRRRGHWMRLSERCAQARARGVDRVFVRDCYVGDQDFTSNGRRYQVLLDFQETHR